jgi:hypothetical protein
MPRSPRGRSTRFQRAPRGSFIGRGGFCRPNLAPFEGDDEGEFDSPMYDQYEYMSRRAYARDDDQHDEEVDEADYEEEEEEEFEEEFEEDAEVDEEVEFNSQTSQ